MTTRSPRRTQTPSARRSVPWRSAAVLGLAVSFLGVVTAAPTRADDGFEADEAPVRPLPFSIRKDLEALEGNSARVRSLVRTLARANDELATAYAEYAADPKDAVAASKVERALAVQSGRVLGSFDSLIAEQDVLISSFKNVNRKLDTFAVALDRKVDGAGERLATVQAIAKRKEADLVKLAVQIKHDPPEDPEQLARLKDFFKEQLGAFRLQQRHARDLTRHYKSRRHLADGFNKLQTIFTTLHEKFATLVANLENERAFLRDTIELQKESLEIRELVRGAMAGGERSIAGVTDNLANAYLAVDGFQKVHEMLTENLGSFGETEDMLLGLAEKVDSVVDGIDGPMANKGIDAIIEEFAGKELDLGEE